jgi:hypothetical protein
LTVLKADSMNGLSLGGAGASKQLRHTVIFTQPLDRFGFHLAVAIIDDFGALMRCRIARISSIALSAAFMFRCLPAIPAASARATSL